MVKQHVLFIQGAGDDVHDTWDDKLAHGLSKELGDAYTVRYPRMPDEASPQYAAWKAALIKELDTLGDGAFVVGHSVGATMLLHTLVDHHPKRLSAIILIAAPFIGDGGWPSDEMQARVDFAERLPKGVPVVFYHGTADETVPFKHAGLYAKLLPHAAVRMLAHRDHQLNNDMSDVADEIRALTPTQSSPAASS